MACNFIKKETPTPVFSCEYHKMFEKCFFMEHLQWLLLRMVEEFLKAVLHRTNELYDLTNLNM